MEVCVLVPAVLRELSGGHARLVFQLREAATVAELLDVVATAHRALERRVRDEQGALRDHVNLFVGEDNVRDRLGTATVLRGGDQVSILAAISGG